MTERVECVVIGAGVVGLAIARALALTGREVLVLEAESAFGTHTSSRNSEVIHAGIYYPTDSLKASTCVHGKELLYTYCRQREIDHRRLGKLIVATESEQIEVLQAYQTRGQANGINDLELLTQQELNQLEPEVQGLAALWSPSTGIVDSHALMLSLLGDLENAAGTLVLRSPVSRFRQVAEGFEIEVEANGVPMKLQSRCLINSAGHGAVALARASETDHPIKTQFLAGHYFGYSGKSPFKHLVYPVAGASSLGTHATLDLGGHTKFGPDIDWREKLDYKFDLSETRQQHFETSVRKYYPGLETSRLQPGYVGIRPRIPGPGEPAADFVIAGPESHGVTGLVQLFGIESPGLTANLAIAEQVVTRLS
ncbi:MAG: NAD(P)/FAD-dependent oxidoreductase [Gammaproteobacteria bacterium]|nr:NAD(P)/FAD-dependent oxidoreductase [Gammaproteobacteria bacterium]